MTSKIDQYVTADILEVAEKFVGETRAKCEDSDMTDDDASATVSLVYAAFLYGAKTTLALFGFDLDQEMFTKNKNKLFPQDKQR